MVSLDREVETRRNWGMNSPEERRPGDSLVSTKKRLGDRERRCREDGVVLLGQGWSDVVFGLGLLGKEGGGFDKSPRWRL